MKSGGAHGRRDGRLAGVGASQPLQTREDTDIANPAQTEALPRAALPPHCPDLSRRSTCVSNRLCDRLGGWQQFHAPGHGQRTHDRVVLVEQRLNVADALVAG